MKIKTSFNDCEYLTAGKEYPALMIYGDSDNGWHGADILDDDDEELYTQIKNSSHLDGDSWEIIE